MMNRKTFLKGSLAASLSTLLFLSTTGCGGSASSTSQDEAVRTGSVEGPEEDKEVQFFSSSTIIPDSIEWKNSASGQTFAYAQEALPDLTFTFQNFVAENATITYDEACTERIRDYMGDDIVMLNTDTITNLGREGLLADLSDLEGADALLPAVRASLTVDGKLVAFPWEYIAYGLIVNNDVLKEHGLEIPETPDEFFACCEKLKADGMAIPMAANRWWLECFVLTQGFLDFYQSENMEQLIADLNDGTTKMSQYMRPGFEFLKTCIDKGYIDAEQANSYEAFMERDAFLAHESAFMTSFTGAVTGEGRKLNSYDFDLRVVGFPTEQGQVALSSATGMAIPTADENMENAKRAVATLCSAEGGRIYCSKSGNFPARSDVKTDIEEMPVLKGFMDDINAGRLVSAANPSINMELWGNTCVVVRDLLAGASVDECMDEIDQLQQEANEAAG